MSTAVTVTPLRVRADKCQMRPPAGPIFMRPRSKRDKTSLSERSLALSLQLWFPSAELDARYVRAIGRLRQVSQPFDLWCGQ
jgi:hypothetical protein